MCTVSLEVASPYPDMLCLITIFTDINKDKVLLQIGISNKSVAGKREFSPVILAGFVAFGVTTGAILLNSGVLLSEQALGGLPQSQAAGSSIAPSSLNNVLTDSLVLDEKTRLLLNAALVFLGLGALLIGKSCNVPQANRDITCKNTAQLPMNDSPQSFKN